MDKVLAFSKKILKEVIDKNSIVVDATCGNGNDTLFLAQSAAKKVYAFDIQQQAIDSTLKLLQTNNCLEKCEVILDSHSNFDNYISEPIKAVVFNLGYLPNADHTITTLTKLDQKEVEVLSYQFINQKNNAPFVLALEKKNNI